MTLLGTALSVSSSVKREGSAPWSASAPVTNVAKRERWNCFALDDFGTGSSCLSYLSRLPLDQLKIDRSFVLNLPRNRNDAIIAQTIITMATSLGLGVVAEGVETPEQLRFLEEHACEAFQGYLLGRPLPAAELERRLADDGSGPQDVEALAA